MYFADLSAYNYSPIRLDGDAPVLLNVGWLDAEHDFQREPAAPELITCLVRMAALYKVATRGVHPCPFCKTRITMSVDGKDVFLGHAEIRARAGDITYVAPSLLPHYMAAHDYEPPAEALDAFRQAPLGQAAPG